MSTRPVALITGASSGIGAALAEHLAPTHDLVLVARRRARLEALADTLDTRTEVLVADLATRPDLDRVVARVNQGDLNVVISNAGVGGYAPLAEVAPAEVDRLWTLNAIAPLVLARAAVPHLIKAGGGGVITIASLLAFSSGLGLNPYPPRTLYAGAKAATVAFTRSLAGELDGTGVTATVVCPGLVATEWSGGANHDNPRAMSPQDVATAAWTAFTRGDTVCVPALDDPDLFEHFTDAEAALLNAGNRSTLATRYR
ncbi:MAG TPA: SDR family NAD(P)-dependent oxidoreductase [Umezawaea sp.]|nr:SDR family NAD(P)-dependent oxidoreductase [Umezawaea sp.]